MARPADGLAARLAPRRLAGLGMRLLLLAVFVSVPAWLVLQHFAAFEPWLYPLHRLQSAPRAVAPGITIGPYPDQARLLALRADGYRLVVSVLSPDLVYEASLIRREQQYAQLLGLEFHDFPMHGDEPASSPRNARALQALGELLAARPGEPAYVHCYLGKHRARMVAEWLARQPAVAAAQR